MTFLVGSGSSSGSGAAFRLRLRLRLRIKFLDGSGSGSGSRQNVPAPAPMIKSSYEPKPAIRFLKMQNVKIWLRTDLAVTLNATLNECL